MVDVTLHFVALEYLLTGADCVPIGSSGLTHFVVSDNAELDNIPVTSLRVKVVKQQVLCVHSCMQPTQAHPHNTLYLD